MNVADAVQTIVQHVRDTNTPLAEAVRAVWSRVAPLPPEEAQTLVMESLASRAGTILRNPLLSTNEDRPQLTVIVKREAIPTTRHEVTVQLLSDTIYHVNGQAKPVAVFTKHDVITKIDSVRMIEKGVVRHRQMWEYIAGRLTACKKNKVEDLGHGEQMKIARMIFDLRQTKSLELA